jgi:hypothetical protein
VCKAIKKNTETLIDASREVVLEVNTEKTKYILLSHQQNAGKNHDIKIAYRCFENVAQFKYLAMTITHSNLIQEEIKRRLNILSFRLLSKNVNIRMYKNIILPVILYGHETWNID